MSDEERFKCDACDSSFRKAKHLRYHRETVHATERQYVCEHCGNSYKRSSHLKRHVQNSHSSVDLLCTWEDCGRVFKGPEQLRKHIRRHESRDAHACGLCGKSFSKKRQLESHKDKIHGPFGCTRCERVFSNRTEFRLHMQTAHQPPPQQEEIHCPYCPECTFSNETEYRNHLKTHANFPCTLCGTAFTRERDLRSHCIEKHDPEYDNPNNPTCPYCGVIFSTVSNLNAHIRVLHQGNRPFACSECGKSFGHKHVLQRHIDCVHRAFTPEKAKRKREIALGSSEPDLSKLRVFTVTVGPDEL